TRVLASKYRDPTPLPTRAPGRRRPRARAGGGVPARHRVASRVADAPLGAGAVLLDRSLGVPRRRGSSLAHRLDHDSTLRAAVGAGAPWLRRDCRADSGARSGQARPDLWRYVATGPRGSDLHVLALSDGQSGGAGHPADAARALPAACLGSRPAVRLP